MTEIPTTMMPARASFLTRAARLGRANWLTLAEAFAALAIASAAIRAVPFRRLVGVMAADVGRAAPDPEVRDRMVARSRWAVQLWADRVPWRAVCFQRGLALHWMLRRRGIASSLHYGASLSGRKGLAAHVWLTVEGRVILGGDVEEDYACLAVYPAPADGGRPLEPLRAPGTRHG